jgi:hypothetical protein
MKSLKLHILAVLTATALTATVGVPGASATTLEIGGIVKNETVAFEASLAAGTSLQWTTTFEKSPLNTCTESTFNGFTESGFTATTVRAPLTILSFFPCAEPVIVDKAGKLSFEHIAGTTNGTIRWSGAQVTVSSRFGKLSCVFENTDIGILNGVKTGNATLEINFMTTCSSIPVVLTGIYIITSPAGLGGLGITS